MRKRQATVGVAACSHERVLVGSVLKAESRTHIAQICHMSTMCFRVDERRHRVPSELRWWLTSGRARGGNIASERRWRRFKCKGTTRRSSVPSRIPSAAARRAIILVA